MHVLADMFSVSRLLYPKGFGRESPLKWYFEALIDSNFWARERPHMSGSRIAEACKAIQMVKSVSF